MKKKILLITACALALTAANAFAGAAAGTGVVNSKHDMRAYAAANGGERDQYERVCAYCHTPHHALEEPNGDYAPLWSREFSQVSFDGYQSVTFSQSAAVVDPVAGPSRLCMSCHDGAVAIDAYYGKSTTDSTMTFDTDEFGHIAVGLEPQTLTNDHPIGFNYDLARAADLSLGDGIESADVATFNGGTRVRDVLFNFDGAGVNEMMTCATCHEVHNSAQVDSSDANTGWFLYGTQTDSRFCTTCHLKGDTAP
jgi:hypothetical protein